MYHIELVSVTIDSLSLLKNRKSPKHMAVKIIYVTVGSLIA